MIWFLYFLLYIISISISYLLFRQFLKNDKDARYYSMSLTIFIMLLPALNIAIPLVLIVMSKIEKRNLNLDYKKFFRL